MRKSINVLLALAIIVFLIHCSPASAQNKPIQLSLVSPVQIYSANYSITGVRISLIYGNNASVSGFDWGLVSRTTSGQSMGVQFALVGMADADFVGWQDAAVNMVKGHFEGFQWGFVNSAHEANGLQFGLVNYAGTMKGLQIGLVNIIGQGGTFPVFPIVNWSF